MSAQVGIGIVLGWGLAWVALSLITPWIVPRKVGFSVGAALLALGAWLLWH